MTRSDVLVLGAGGFLGRHLTLACAEAGRSVIAATRRPVEFRHPLVTNQVARFDDPACFGAALGSADTVIHAASSTTPGASAAKPQLEGNLRTTLALLEALQEYPRCRLVYLSSAGTLYGNRGQPARETDAMRPHSYHGAGKAAAEMFIRAWAAQYGGVAVILRPSNIYGPGQPRQAGFGIIPAAFHCVANDLELTVWGDGTSVRDYLYIDDFIALCNASRTAALPPGTHVLNAASGESIQLDTVLAEVERVAGRRLRRRHVAARRVDLAQVQVDVAEARRVFGWQAGTAFRDGLRPAWDWFVANT